MKLLYRSLLLLAPLLILASPPSADATTVLKIGMDELATTSTWVVRADVIDTEVVDRRGLGEGIFTDVKLSIRAVYKGANVPATYTLRLIGGTGADGRTLKVPGIPVFSPGEQVVLFLEPTILGHIPTGLGQGVWRVLTTPSGDEWVRQATGSAHFVARDEQGRLAEVDPASLGTTIPLWDLLQDLYQAMERQ